MSSYIWLLWYGPDSSEYWLYGVYQSRGGAVDAGPAAYRRYAGYRMGTGIGARSKFWRETKSGLWEADYYGCYLRAERVRVKP